MTLHSQSRSPGPPASPFTHRPPLPAGPAVHHTRSKNPVNKLLLSFHLVVQPSPSPPTASTGVTFTPFYFPCGPRAFTATHVTRHSESVGGVINSPDNSLIRAPPSVCGSPRGERQERKEIERRKKKDPDINAQDKVGGDNG